MHRHQRVGVGICLLRAADLQKILPPDLLLWKFRQISFFHSEKEKFLRAFHLARRFYSKSNPASGSESLLTIVDKIIGKD